MIDCMTAEELAIDVLNKIKQKNGNLEFPIDPFNILKESGVYVTLRDFNNIDGIIIKDDDNSTIVGINVNNRWSRQRFTAAHEYCHFIKDLKKDDGKSDVIRCLKNSKSTIEKFANTFASYLLMPTDELIKICNEYKNKKGYIDFESITIIAEYFGVSFSSCLYRVAYELHLIDGDTSAEFLEQRMGNYKPEKKRKELIETTVDSKLLSNMINSLSYIMFELNRYTGSKFLQQYIYNDNKLEGVIIDRSELNYILADLNFNKENSKYFDSKNENVCMTLGNFEMQQYVVTTEDEVSIKKCSELHKLLYKYVPYPDDNGKYRIADAVLKRGTTQPISYIEIYNKVDELETELQFFIKNVDSYSISEYIEQVAYFIYKFIVIHPFPDGNGRISRALLNWMLKLKNISPIYVDVENKDDYYNALSEIDLHENYVPFIMYIERRIINTMLEVNQYLFIDDIDVTEED